MRVKHRGTAIGSMPQAQRLGSQDCHGGAGSRRQRAGMLMTSTEWTPPASASAPAASTAARHVWLRFWGYAIDDPSRREAVGPKWHRYAAVVRYAG